MKNKGYMELTNQEHLHDVGKFMFAFSIFWTYLWFSQYMLIWYANIPEETVYFKHRVQGPYKGIFFLNLIINFLCPLLILMKRAAKRNYTLVTFMAVLIIFGHWIDFYQMVMGSLSKEHVTLGWLDFGILAFFCRYDDFLCRKSISQQAFDSKVSSFHQRECNSSGLIYLTVAVQPSSKEFVLNSRYHLSENIDRIMTILLTIAVIVLVFVVIFQIAKS